MTFTFAGKKAAHIQIWGLCGIYIASKLEKVGQVQYICIFAILSYS